MYRLWANEFLDIWISITTPHSWESSLISLFARFANHTVGYFDWNPYIPFVNNFENFFYYFYDFFLKKKIFSHVLRGFGLPIFSSNNKTPGNMNITSISNIFAYSSSDITSICNWIVSMIVR